MFHMVTQPDLPDIGTASDWQGVQDLIQEIQRDEQCKVFAKTLFQWDLAIKIFRKTETRRITLGNPTEQDFKFHALCLGALISSGSALCIWAKTFTSEELGKFNVTYEQIDAYVEELKQSFREWHHGFSSSEVDTLRNKIFGAA